MRLAVAVAVLTVAAVAVVVLALPGSPWGAARAAEATPHQSGAAGSQIEPDLGLPASQVVAFGASPAEGSGEAWAYGYVGDVPALVDGQTIQDQWVLLERGGDGIWQIVPLPESAGGQPLATGTASGTPASYGIFGGQATPDGGVVLISGQNVVVRDPGQQPYLASSPGTALASGESLLDSHEGSVPYTAVDEGGGHTGVLIAPYKDGELSGGATTTPGVLHFDGTTRTWTREPVEVPSGDSGFTPLALQCGPTAAAPSTDAPSNCWLLANVTSSSGGTQPLLLMREPSADPSGDSWVPEQISGSLISSASLPSGVSSASVSSLAQGAQMLTVTTQGVWVDFSATANAGSPTDVSELVAPGAASGAGTSTPTVGNGSVQGTWCYPTTSWCGASLGSAFPTGYRSFAWAGASGTGPGTRVISGLSDQGLLELNGAGNFAPVAGGGGSNGQASGGAAFASLSQGWLADDSSEVLGVTTSPASSALTSEPVPFDKPLMAVTTEAGNTPGETGSPALAVGLNGQVARYTPGQGWAPESLLNGAGVIQTPTLTGVAWPEAGRAYAVGSNCAMWLWQSTTDLWEADPAKPYNCTANFTGVAFQPGDPDVGYAVGKQGVLLAYSKTWTQVVLPDALQNVDFTSIAFAGSEALATYRYVTSTPTGQVEAGGVAVDDGSGWEVDQGVNTLLADSGVPIRDTVLSKISGLADGGVVAAGPGLVIERDSSADDWSLTAEPLAASEAENVSAIAAFRDSSSGQIRAIVSVDTDAQLNPEAFAGNLSNSPWSGDVPFPDGELPTIESADPLPDSGFLLEQTGDGWEDLEHQDYPSASNTATSGASYDGGLQPDPVLALSVDPDGSAGLAVGGETGDSGGAGATAAAETSAVMSFGAGAGGAVNTGTATITTDASQASFVLGGDASCAQASCGGQANDAIAPDVDLQHAIAEASGIQGARAFLYAGGRLPAGNGLTGSALGGQLARLGADLGSGSSLSVYAAGSGDTTDAGAASGEFSTALGTSLVPARSLSGTTAPPAGSAYYAFQSTAASGPVDVIVLDYSSGSLGEPAGSTCPASAVSTNQFDWLCAELAAAKASGVPVIVMGADSLGFTLPGTGDEGAPAEASDATTVAAALISGGASAYLFDYPGDNVAATVTSNGQSIPAFGSGTLGYVDPEFGADGVTDDLGNSAFLVVSVQTAARNAGTNVAPVTAVAIPNAASVALDAEGGTLLKRSEVTLFDALARRPLAGSEWVPNTTTAGSVFEGPDPYDPIPFDCTGLNCSYAVPEQVTFSSSNPDIGGFVQHQSGTNDPLAVALNASGQPIASSSSGLFCAYNAGTTTVTVSTAGLTFSLPVTVQRGSVEQPCGTTPITNPPTLTTSATVSGFSSGGPSPSGKTPQTETPVASPKAPSPAPHHQPAAHLVPRAAATHPPAAVAQPKPVLVPVHPFVPNPAPSPARPTPPSGTAQVQQTSQVSVESTIAALEHERESEHATQLAHHMVVARPFASASGSLAAIPSGGTGGGGLPSWLLVLVLPAALGGAGLCRRRPSRKPAYLTTESDRRRSR